MKLLPQILNVFLLSAITLVGGCSLIPEARNRDVMHNPFPQLKRVAVLPFFNQSTEPTVNGDLVAQKYYAALQAIPGFEVLPVGVVKAQWIRYSMQYGEPTTGADFQALAQAIGAEAIVVGSVTDYDAYYPPRMAMTVHWYAANEGFHPIPAGYGLPWGTEQEKQIPRRIAREAEFELARSQLATQTPVTESTQSISVPSDEATAAGIPTDEFLPSDILPSDILSGDVMLGDFLPNEAPMPAAWPDPTDLIPDPPQPVAPLAIANHEPVLSHTRIYNGDDPYFTARLADHVETGDDARTSGWQGYLKRSDDFVRFCCHLHITEMLESRGGADQSEFILRWPLSRY